MAYKNNEKATPITQRASALKYTGAVDLTSGKQLKKFQSFKIDASKKEEEETQAPPPPLDEGECVDGKNTVTGEPCGSSDDEGKCVDGKNTKTGETCTEGSDNDKAVTDWLNNKDKTTGLTGQEVINNLGNLWKL